MARIEYIQEKKEDRPASVERIEVRVWGPGGKLHQEFVIGSGANFHAPGTLVLEIVYSVNDIQVFYTRNYLQFEGDEEDAVNVEKQLERFELGEVDTIGFGDMLPETFVYLARKKYDYQDQNGLQAWNEYYQLEIGADMGAVFGSASPGERMLTFKLAVDNREDGIQFMRELTHEVTEVFRGRRPNPANLPTGSSDWQFVRQLNQKAYDIISQDYDEDYFSKTLLTEMFDTWLSELPAGSHILDAGCGHGKPVIARILEKGYRVTGTDLSPKMLERAREHFPTVELLNQMVSDIRSESEYDGACSFSSMLYLDPIDLSHSIHRLYHAIKPGGLLFLHADDLHPGWRGAPYTVDINQWMWTWSHGMDEVADALEQFGYFKVLKMENVTTEEEKETRIARWRKYTLEQHDKLINSLPPEIGSTIPPPDVSKVPSNLSYGYAIMARRVEPT